MSETLVQLKNLDPQLERGRQMVLRYCEAKGIHPPNLGSLHGSRILNEVISIKGLIGQIHTDPDPRMRSEEMINFLAHCSRALKKALVRGIPESNETMSAGGVNLQAIRI